MKKLAFILALSAMISCGEGTKSDNTLKNTAELQVFEDLKAEEASTRKFIEMYLADANSSDWKSKLPKYLPSDPDAFLEEHTAFRVSFPNYRSTIKHLTVDGNKAIVWLNVTANYAKTFLFENTDDNYGDNLIRGIEAENQALSWDETWYFDVVDGKFGNEWDFLKDKHAILESLKAVPK